MTQQVQKMFSAIAPRYDRLNHLLSFNIDRWWRREAVAHLTECAHVLDLCAGTLDLSICLAEHNPNVAIEAIDFSDEMLQFGQKKLNKTLAQQIHSSCGDVQQLPFQDESFDGAMVAYGMRNVDNKEQTLKETLRVLKPGGCLVILEFFKPDRWAAKLFHATYGRYILPALGGLVSGNREAYRYLRDSIRGFYTAEEYKDLMEHCGFSAVTCKHQLGGASTLIVGVKQ